MRLFHLLDAVPMFRRWVNKVIEARNEVILDEILPHLGRRDRLLDLGSGTGHTAHSLIAAGFKVTCVDYSNMNIFEDTKPIIYDGVKLPLESNSFDTVLLITVLHHTPVPETIIREAARVAGKIIIMEDTYHNVFQKWLTFVMDSLGNLEFAGHPHSNKDNMGWRRLFDKCGLEVSFVNHRNFLVFFESSLYVLRRK